MPRRQPTMPMADPQACHAFRVQSATGGIFRTTKPEAQELTNGV